MDAARAAVTTPPAFRVRRIRPREWAALRAFRLRALAADPRAFGATLDEEAALGEEAWRERAREGAEGPLRLVAVAAEAGSGAWLGMVGGRRLEEGEWEVVSLWTAPEGRGRGVGDALVRFAVAWAGEAGASRVVLWVTTENAAAARLYARCGFAPEGEATQGRRDPSRWFQKMARPAPGRRVGR